MDHIKVSDKEGLELIITSNEPSNYDPIMGGDPRNPTWEEYVDQYLEEFQPHIELMKDGITKLGWVGETGGNKANDTFFVFSDGTSIGLTWRAWGDFMQAIVGKQEGYMAYYM